MFSQIHNFWLVKNKLWKLLLKIQNFGQKWTTLANKYSFSFYEPVSHEKDFGM